MAKRPLTSLLERLLKASMTVVIPRAPPAISPGLQTTKMNSSSCAQTTPRTSTSTTVKEPGEARSSAENTMTASCLSQPTTARRGKARTSPADPFRVASTKAPSSMQGANARKTDLARKASASKAAETRLATCPGPWATPPGGSLPMRCAAAKKSSEQQKSRKQTTIQPA